MDVFLLSADEAAQVGLIDNVVQRRPVWRQFHMDQKGNPILSRVEGHGEFKTKDFNLYRIARTIEKEEEQKQLNKTTQRKTTVGLVYLTGTMMRGLNDNGASLVANAIVDAGHDSNVDSILLRIGTYTYQRLTNVDSGGGDAIAAESIWQAIKRVQEEEKKPVIANFGNVSASGGIFLYVYSLLR
jgi:ClpP class serine protease